MNKYAYIVCADRRYLPEVVANLNSLNYVHNEFDVHFYGYRIPDSVIEQFSKANYNIIYHPITDDEVQESHGLSEVVCRKRYKFVNDLKDMYDSICVLDADMVFVRNPKNFFEIAAKTGLVLGATKEQRESYNDPHHTYKGKWIMPEGFTPIFDLCNCPLFIDPKIWGDCLEESFNIFIDDFPNTNFKAPDMAAMNLCLCAAGSNDKTIGMPGIQWLGTNEQMLKPYMRVVLRNNEFFTESGWPIYSYHGQFYHEKWRNCQLDNRHRCAEGYLGYSEKSDNMAEGALRLLTETFYKMLRLGNGINIDELEYRKMEY